MRAYKFKTRISEKGIIQIPIDPNLYNKEVEITIVPKLPRKKRQLKATEFVNKWAGFLKNIDTDDAKYDYLSEKYK
ncbi:MAG: hypothetical protein ACM3P1_01610 [Candidatus Saccharibacteria bacterium]